MVVAGSITDPYTGQALTFAKARAADVQIDHVVALSDAWQKGAQQWDATKRKAFANDPVELLAVDGPTNMRKGDGDTATWLLPKRLRRAADRGEGEVRPLGDAGGTRRHGPRAAPLPRSAAPHRLNRSGAAQPS